MFLIKKKKEKIVGLFERWSRISLLRDKMKLLFFFFSFLIIVLLFFLFETFFSFHPFFQGQFHPAFWGFRLDKRYT